MQSCQVLRHAAAFPTDRLLSCQVAQEETQVELLHSQIRQCQEEVGFLSSAFLKARLMLHRDMAVHTVLLRRQVVLHTMTKLISEASTSGFAQL